jgi:hypothetical protein
MKRTMVAREVRDQLHGAEASMEAALADARVTLERLVTAKVELGLTGTLGDAAIARMRDTVSALEAAQASLIESHKESYTVLQATNIRGVAFGATFPDGASLDEELRAA